jgi:hypothetical protein
VRTLRRHRELLGGQDVVGLLVAGGVRGQRDRPVVVKVWVWGGHRELLGREDIVRALL